MDGINVRKDMAEEESRNEMKKEKKEKCVEI